MISILPYNTQFTLSRDYLAECFDQSLPYGKNARPNYLFPTLLLAAGVGLLAYTEQPKYLGVMLIGLALLELLHNRFRRAWWLARQAWGKSFNTQVKLTIDEHGIQTQNPYTQTSLLWADIERSIETDLGLILVAKQGQQQYLSKSLFSAEVINEILSRSQNKKARRD